MSFALLYALVRVLLDALLSNGQSELRLRAEVLALRYQLRVLQRQVRRPRWQPADRLYFSALSRLLPRDARRSLLPSPETLLRWHRELVRRKWSAFRSRPPRRSSSRHELHELILRLARENPRWGYRRIQGELLKLGWRCSHLTIARLLRRHHIPPAPRRSHRSWRQFVRRHADHLLSHRARAVARRSFTSASLLSDSSTTSVSRPKSIRHATSSTPAAPILWT